MKILFAAGGTGGHVNPALAVAGEVRRRFPEAEILFVGTADKIEAQLVPKAGFSFKSIDITGFQRSFAPSDIIYNLGTLKKLLFVTGQCKKIIKEFNPDVAVGFGGYVSGPVIRTAHKLGVKTAIHEQNAFPGKTNIALSKYADAVMLTAKEAEKYLHSSSSFVTGLPVREEILTAERSAARKKLGISEDKTVILSTGGSLGAEAVNRVMCEMIKLYSGKGIVFIHGYGQNGTWVPDKLKEYGIDYENNPDLRVSEYIYDMADSMASADLVIGRAGASSLAEIQALGKPSFLIPYPYASENHQYHNALTLENQGAAFVCEQKNLTAEKTADIINELISDPDKFRKMGSNARNMAKFDAKSKIADIVISLGQK